MAKWSPTIIYQYFQHLHRQHGQRGDEGKQSDYKTMEQNAPALVSAFEAS
jgi:hypothetical protein